MLPKSSRLPRKESLTLIRSGKKIPGIFFDLTYQYNNSMISRWMINVPKKVLPKAHDRNRLKRLMRAATAEITKLIKQPIDGIIRCRRPLPNTQLLQVKQLLQTQLSPLL